MHNMNVRAAQDDATELRADKRWTSQSRSVECILDMDSMPKECLSQLTTERWREKAKGPEGSKSKLALDRIPLVDDMQFRSLHM
jgi:hypothetical protein